MSYNVMAVLISHRSKSVPKVQQILTKYGCIIKTRLGLHDIGEGYCSSDGMLILHLQGSQEEIENLNTELNELENIQASKIEFKSE